jgi:hypothetical protein
LRPTFANSPFPVRSPERGSYEENSRGSKKVLHFVGEVWKRLLTGVEAITLINESCSVSSASSPPREDRLPTVGVARPLVQDKHSGKVCQIVNPRKQFARQVVDRQSRIFRAEIKRGQFFDALTWDFPTTHLDPSVWSVLDEPIGDLNHLDGCHREAERQPQSRSEHFVGKNANVLRIILKLGDIGRAVRCSEQVGLRSASKSAEVLDGGDARRHRPLLYFG